MSRCFTLFLALQSLVVAAISAFVPLNSDRSNAMSQLRSQINDDNSANNNEYDLARRSCLGGAAAAATFFLASPSMAEQQQSDMYSPKFVQQYEDFTETKEGWRYRDVKQGTGGESAQPGDRVVYDWSGYTIGYFGRPFEAKGGPQGGAFDKELDYFRTVVGSGTVVKGLEQAFIGMKAGGVRQVVIPYGGLSYPANDSSHERVGPKPTTFSGMRALNFVLDNPRVDRTILFNVKLIRVDKPNGKGGFVRG